MSSITIISSGQPSANPRLVKEASALVTAGYKVTVVYCPLSPWSDTYDEELFYERTTIKWIKAGYSIKDERILFLYARIRRRFFEVLYNFTGQLFFAERALVLFVQELYKVASGFKADLYIGHNLGALPVVIKLARKNRAKSGFDAEDFHRGEDKEGSKHWEIATLIETEYLPKANYVSTASPLIAHAYRSLFKNLSIFTINNVFPVALLQQKKQLIPLNIGFRMFWFSQTIGKKRGIEDVIEAMGKLNNKNVQLSLLGNITEANEQFFLDLMKRNNVLEDQVHFYGVVKESELPVIAAAHHVGLALEVPETKNRRLCLTNKIFLYLLAGNAIIFSSTPAQKLFLEQYPEIGSIYQSGSPEELAGIIFFYINNPSVLHTQKSSALELAKNKLNWEIESELLLLEINKVLN